MLNLNSWFCPCQPLTLSTCFGKDAISGDAQLLVLQDFICQDKVPPWQSAGPDLFVTSLGGGTIALSYLMEC